jgi:hypothetical protein
MTTARETALAALETLLIATFPNQFLRDPEKPPADADYLTGLVIMRDGDPGQPTVTLSPVRYEWDHAVAIELSAHGVDRKAQLDGLLSSFDTALAGARTLSGAVLDARVLEGPVIEEVETDGTETVRFAPVAVRLFYVSTSPIG